MAKNYLFSTGVLSMKLASDGSGYGNSDVIGAVQNAQFNIGFQSKEMREAKSVNNLPVDVVSYDSDLSLSLEVGEFFENLLVWMAGMAKSTSGSNNIYTFTGQSEPLFVRFQLVGKLSDGRAATLTMERAKAPAGLQLGMKRDDYTMPSLDLHSYPVDATTAAAVLTIAQS